MRNGDVGVREEEEETHSSTSFLLLIETRTSLPLLM